MNENSNTAAASILDDPLLTRAEVIGVLKVSRVLLWRLIKDGRFPAPLKIGDVERWRRSTIERHLSSLEEASR